MSSTHSLGDIASIVRSEECDYPHCDDSYNAADTPSSPFCSETCGHRATALGIFEDIRQDSRFCSNCYRQIRMEEEQGRFMRSSKVRADVYYQKHDNRQYPIRVKDPEDPFAYFRDDDNRHAATTMRTPTRHTIRGDGGQREVALSDPHPDSDWCPADSSSATFCRCGMENHRTIERPVQLDTLMNHAKRLSDVVETLRAESKHEYAHDRDTLLDMVRERKADPESPDYHTPDQQSLINSLADALDFETDANPDSEP